MIFAVAGFRFPLIARGVRGLIINHIHGFCGIVSFIPAGGMVLHGMGQNFVREKGMYLHILIIGSWAYRSNSFYSYSQSEKSD